MFLFIVEMPYFEILTFREVMSVLACPTYKQPPTPHYSHSPQEVCHTEPPFQGKFSTLHVSELGFIHGYVSFSFSPHFVFLGKYLFSKETLHSFLPRNSK